MRNTIAILIGLLLMLGSTARAELVKKPIEYKQGDATLKGYLVYDDKSEGKRPGIVVVPEWWGLNDYIKHRADQLAELGYVALAADIYGDGQVTTDAKEAGKLAGKYRGDRNLLRARAQAALDTLKAQPQVDPSKIAAIGYCFGGTAALELARAGADLNGIVSFHGGLDTDMPAKKGEVKPKILILTGGDDPMVPKKQVQAAEKEFKDAGADVKVITYPGAIHAFTNPDADKFGIKGIGYNKEADEKSWQEMKEFFDRVLK
jgi:dienelactone hydrolase